MSAPASWASHEDAEPAPLLEDFEEPELLQVTSPFGGSPGHLRRYLTAPRLSLAGVGVLFAAALLLPDSARAHAGHDAVKLLQGRPSEVTSLTSDCRREILATGDFWCCSSGDTTNFWEITGSGSVSCSPYCFPGEAFASVEGKGDVALKDISLEDRVLARQPTGELQYEPVVGFLHRLEGGAERSHQYVAIEHADGELRVSETHLVFVEDERKGFQSKAAATVTVGDEILVATVPGAGPVRRSVLAVHQGQRTHQGMVAPLTASGTIVVDGVVASVYAAPSIHLPLPHCAAHAAFFLVRAVDLLGLRSAVSNVHSFVSGGEDYTHPFAAMLGPSLRLDRLLVKGA